MDEFDREHEDNLHRIRAGELRAEEVDYPLNPRPGCFQHLITHDEDCPDCRSRRRDAEDERRVWDARDELAREQRRYDEQAAAATRQARTKTTGPAARATATRGPSVGTESLGVGGGLGVAVVALWLPILVVSWLAVKVLKGPAHAYTSFLGAIGGWGVLAGLVAFGAALAWRRASTAMMVVRGVAVTCTVTFALVVMLGVGHGGFLGFLLGLAIPAAVIYLTWRWRAADAWLLTRLDRTAPAPAEPH